MDRSMTSQTPDPAPGRGFASFFPTPNRDDLSSHRHRQLIGWLGALLPILVWLMAGWRPTEGLEPWGLLGSVSAYYHTGAVAVFVGVLIALAIFLFTYRGYKNEDRQRDQLAAVVAGIAAVGVALFPTGAPGGLPTPLWCTALTKTIHYVSAAILFGSFVVFSLYLFRKTNVKRDEQSDGKKVRNHVYVVCGVAISLCMAWAGIAGIVHAPVFWAEALALEFFALSWLMKGRADWTLARAGERTRDYVRRRRRPMGKAKNT
jgi:heme A synthase